MEHLTKQQIVLVTLLVSFVTALATGIVTVSLMNQSPNVGQTISRVIERTIESVAAPQSAAVGTITFEDQIANAVEKVASSTVQIESKIDGTVVGIGLVVSKDGVIVTDKSVVAKVQEYVAVLRNGKQFPVVIVQSQINGDIVFLASSPPNISLSNSIIPITFAKSPKLGQTVLSLSGDSAGILGQGVVTETTFENKVANSSTISVAPATIIHTSIPKIKVALGSPLFNVNGEVVGINLSSIGSADEANFYSINSLEGAIPVIRK